MNPWGYIAIAAVCATAFILLLSFGFNWLIVWFAGRYSEKTLNKSVKDIEKMLELGFKELSMEPVVCPPDDPSALTEADMVIVKEQYEKLAELMLNKHREGDPFTFYHYMIDLTGGPCIYKRLSGCGSGT